MKHSLKSSITETGKDGLLSLGGDVTMVYALETKKVLLEAIQEVDTLNLDLHEIESVDVSLVQLICAAHRECYLSGKKILLQGGVGDVMLELMERAGYCKQQGCDYDAKKSCLWSDVCL